MIVLLCVFTMLFSDPVVEITDGVGNIYDLSVGDTEYCEVIQIQQIVHYAYEKTYRATGFSRTRIKVVYPIDGMTRYKYQVALRRRAIIKERILLPLAFKRESLLHEYGHAVMSGLYRYRGDYLPSFRWYTHHLVNSHTDPGFAWIEGWAEFYQCWVDDNAFNLCPYPDRNVPNIEENSWISHASPPDVEGAIASALWDIADTANSIDHTPYIDDDMWDGLGLAVWQIVKDIRPQNMDEFIFEFAARGYPVFAVRHRWIRFGELKNLYR